MQFLGAKVRRIFFIAKKCASKVQFIRHITENEDILNCFEYKIVIEMAFLAEKMYLCATKSS